jgi:hypothetical protein
MLPRLLASRVMASERLSPKSAILTLPSRAAWSVKTQPLPHDNSGYGG